MSDNNESAGRAVRQDCEYHVFHAAILYMADYQRRCERAGCGASGSCRDPECTLTRLHALWLPADSERPSVSDFLAGHPVRYNAGSYGEVEATYRRPSDSPVKVLRIRQVGHRRALKVTPMSEQEATAFLLNIDNAPKT